MDWTCPLRKQPAQGINKRPAVWKEKKGETKTTNAGFHNEKKDLCRNEKICSRKKELEKTEPQTCQ